MRRRSTTPWKKSRTLGDIYGGRQRIKLTDNIFRRYHSLKAPVAGQDLPILMEENPSRNFYFPVSAQELRDVLMQLPEEKREGITHIWLRREQNPSYKGFFAQFICGSKVRVIVLYPWPVDGNYYLGKQKPTGSWLSEYKRVGGTVSKNRDGWFLHLEGEALRRFYFETLFLHELGHHIDWYHRHWSAANVRTCEEFASQFALESGKIIVIPDTEEII